MSPQANVGRVAMLSRYNKTPYFHRHFVSIILRRGGSLENIALSRPCVHIQTQTKLSTRRDVHLHCLFSWHSHGLAQRARLGVRLALKAGSCCPVSSPCEIRLKACSLAHCVYVGACVCVEKDAIWEV